MGRLFIEPGLKPLGDSDAVLAAKSNWMAQAAYHLVACKVIPIPSIAEGLSFRIHKANNIIGRYTGV